MKRLALFLAFALSACQPVATASPEKAQTSSTSGSAGVVTRHIDGDTLVVGDKTVRLIGVDTPETKNKTECYGKEASAYTESLLPVGTPVILEHDVELTDRYGRQLAYVYRQTDGLHVNEALIAGGYATAYPYGKTKKHRGEFALAEDAAQEANVGLWKVCASS